MKDLKKTKIVCTIGPASNKREVLREMILSGMDVARLNFSHGTHEDHKKVIDLIRDLCKETGRSIALLQDLCGPKIRVGNISGGPVMLKSGEIFTFTGEECEGSSTKAHISYAYLSEEVNPGTKIFIDDGLLRLVVEKVDPPDVICRILIGGPLSSHKGVNFPGTELKIPALTDKDKEDLLFGLEQNVDWVALSFVQRPSDIVEIKEIIHKAGKSTPVIAKIEKGEALKQLNKIIDLTDGIMVARGDLSVETPVERLPLEQKNIIALCRKKGKPVITATQMMDSMIRNPRPTNAEVTDVANAILDGTDATMLSEETAVGKYPVEATKMMADIAVSTEKNYRGFQSHTSCCDSLRSTFWEEKPSVEDVISLHTLDSSQIFEAKYIVTPTESGNTARRISRLKPHCWILAFTANPEVVRFLTLSYGVFPFLIPGELDMLGNIMDFLREKRLVKKKDYVILTEGTIRKKTGGTDSIKIIQVV